MSVHVKIGYDEAVNAKKEILFVEKDLLEAIKHIRLYNRLRKIEFSLKNKIKKDFLALNNLIASLESSLPKKDINALGGDSLIAQKEALKQAKNRLSTKLLLRAREIEDNSTNLSLERELKEIHEKLARLG
jgi:hypothetical protein